MHVAKACFALSLWSVAAIAALQPAAALAAEGIVTTTTSTDFRTTLGKLGAAIGSRNLTLFVEVDHAAGAAAAGLSLRPTHLIVFGNPRGGTPAMACAQSIGLDLPMKALVYEDASGKVHIAMPDPAAMAARHRLGDCAAPAIEAMGKALAAIAAEASAP
jgi:uncharacterized protein (DUF302 family)